MENADTTKKLTSFYREQILTLAKNADDAGVRIFPMSGDDASESYFTDRNDGETYIHTIDRDDMTGELEKLWADDRVPGMAGIAEPIVELANILREKEQDSDEVSPFIYAMF